MLQVNDFFVRHFEIIFCNTWWIFCKNHPYPFECVPCCINTIDSCYYCGSRWRRLSPEYGRMRKCSKTTIRIIQERKMEAEAPQWSTQSPDPTTSKRATYRNDQDPWRHTCTQTTQPRRQHLRTRTKQRNAYRKSWCRNGRFKSTRERPTPSLDEEEEERELILGETTTKGKNHVNYLGMHIGRKLT